MQTASQNPAELREPPARSLPRIVEMSVNVEADDATDVLNPAGKRPPTAAKQARKSGEVLNDRFVLEECIGQGGIGTVFRARDLLWNGTDVRSAGLALKVLRDEFRTQPELLHALHREALETQSLSHQNIVRVYDFHRNDDTPFFTMELLEGERLSTLMARLRPSGLEPARAKRIIAGLCSGLAHAHAHGLVHGDIKPGNVYLAAGGEPKILDFGLARATRPASELLVMSPLYASCSRLQGAAPTFADDVYSLSCVIYEILSGRHVYDRKPALQARGMQQRPERIDGLTDRQWRALAAGLDLSAHAPGVDVAELGAAFGDSLATTGSPAAPKRRRVRATVPAVAGFLLGAIAVLAMAVLNAPASFSDTVERLRAFALPAGEAADPIPAAVAEPPLEEISVAPGIREIVLTPPVVTPGFRLDFMHYFVQERTAALAVQVERQGDTSAPATVQWNALAGSAEPELDYVADGPQRLRFAPGEKNRTILVPIVADALAEGDEEFRIVLSNPGNGMILGKPSSATVTIVDDDARPVR